ncbi:MAG: hypothetical protein RRY42_07005 [Mucinivorans sp.]
MQQSTPTLASAPQPAASQKVSGINCPECQNFIPISIHYLLHEYGIVCPHCGLSMTINRAQSKQALDALKTVELASERVKETETFKR